MILLIGGLLAASLGLVWAGGVLGVLSFGYPIYALIRPEKF